MARLSYCGDIFSPVRSDMSFNDSNLKDGNSGRGSISEDFIKAPSVEASIKSYSSTDSFELSECRRKNLPLEEVTLHHKNIKVESRSKKRSDKPVPNSNLVLITPCVKVEDIDSELLIKELPRKSKRLQKNEDKITKKETDSKDGKSQCSNKYISSKLSKKKGSDSVSSNFITIRGGESRKAEQVANRTKSCSVDVFTTSSEMLEEKENNVGSIESSNKTSVHDGSGGNKIKEMTETSIKSESLIPSNQTILHSQLNEKINVAELKTSSNIDNSELKNMIQKDFSGTAALPNEPNQVQAKIIEKLITDTVNSEFDVIRQQLYLQQMSLLKVLNQTRDEFENRYSRNTEHLYTIIEGLLEENRQLRNAIIAQR